VAGSLVLILIVLPWVGIGIVPIAGVYVALSYYYRHSQRELKRLDGITRSPVFAHLSETLQVQLRRFVPICFHPRLLFHMWSDLHVGFAIYPRIQPSGSLQVPV
jgi:hypothetical protein